MLLFSLFFTFSRKYILKDDRATARGPTLVNVTRNGPYELYVNGQLRTTTRTLRNTNYHNLKAGQYLLYINDSSYDEGGNPSIRRDTRKGIGILPSGWIYFYGENDNHDIRDGNMPIKIPSKYFKQNDPAQPFMIIKLPHQNQFRKLRFTMSGGSVLVYPQKIQQKKIFTCAYVFNPRFAIQFPWKDYPSPTPLSESFQTESKSCTTPEFRSLTTPLPKFYKMEVAMK